MRVKFFRILSHPLAMSVSGVRRLPASLGASFADTARANVCSLSSLWTRCKQVTKGAAVCSSLHQGGKYTPNITKQNTGIYRKSLNSRAGLEECWTSKMDRAAHGERAPMSASATLILAPFTSIYFPFLCQTSDATFLIRPSAQIPSTSFACTKDHEKSTVAARYSMHSFTAWRFRVPKISDIDSRQDKNTVERNEINAKYSPYWSIPRNFPLFMKWNCSGRYRVSVGC